MAMQSGFRQPHKGLAAILHNPSLPRVFKIAQIELIEVVHGVGAALLCGKTKPVQCNLRFFLLKAHNAQLVLCIGIALICVQQQLPALICDQVNGQQCLDILQSQQEIRASRLPSGAVVAAMLLERASLPLQLISSYPALASSFKYPNNMRVLYHPHVISKQKPAGKITEPNEQTHNS